ncbi:MAG: hypothetical protein HY936_10575 [Nitrosomonadales bacterium]|nr:hypothetical protein [Nitrosomonadales bacterium]
MYMRQISLCTLVSAIAFVAVGAANARDYESLSDLNAAEFAPPALLQSPLHNVDEKVTLEGGLPRFTIRSKYGTWQARGREMLEIRVSELPAFGQLDSISKTDEFTKAAGKAIAAPVEVASDLLTRPVDTVNSLASGIGNMASSLVNMAGSAATRVSDTVNGDTGVQKPILEPVSMCQGTAAPRTVINGPFGYHAALREWAQKLKVDPYTNNAALSDKLDDFAAASFVGSFPVNITIGIVVAPLSYAVQFNQAAQLESYQLSPGDIETRNEARLKKMGVEGLAVRILFRNSYFTPTLQTSLVLALESLGNIPGHAEVIAFASRAASDIEARYVINSVLLLARHGREGTPIISVRGAGNVIAGATADGKLIVPMPMDYIAWIKPVEDFARRADLNGSERWVLVAGKVTPQAMQELTNLGWHVADNMATAR